jgi:ribonuclease HI
MLDKYTHIIFSDGAALGNPGPGGWGTVVLLSKKIIIELGGGEKHTTNNRMEIMALLQGLRRIEGEHGDVLCCTDSQYVINAVTKWIHGWKKNGWMTSAKQPTLHRELFEEIDERILAHKKYGSIHFKYVPGHVGVAGNERCDSIATAFARKEEPELFNGKLADYAIDILNVGIDATAQEKRQSTKKRTGPAYSYLSLVDGKAQKHATWAECEARVKGKSGVKYKKAMSANEEREILHSWGIKA